MIALRAASSIGVGSQVHAARSGTRESRHGQHPIPVRFHDRHARQDAAHQEIVQANRRRVNMVEQTKSAESRRAPSRARRRAPCDAQMPDIVAALIDEHKYQARLLGVMERQVGLLNQRKLPDYEVMHDVMRYMTQVPDRYHHPKEDLIFDKVLLRDPASAGSVAQLRRAHLDIVAAGAELFDLVDRSRRGVDEGEAEALRDPLRKSAHRYIGTLRRHMDIESLHMFPQALKTLLPGDWREVDAAMRPILDPVFGQQVKTGYEALHSQATAKPVLGSPGKIGVGLIEATALIEAVAALISGMSALRNTMRQHNVQALQQNAQLTRNLMRSMPLAKRGRLFGELCVSNVRMFGDIHGRMTQLWSNTWEAVRRPYNVEPGPYAPKLARRRRRRTADTADTAEQG
ncbi:MAG: hemerythrin domain-containing protein [Ideonella sp.]|nr:hemerythrin domain-containing protein [Ideonella sp.]